MQYDKIKTRSVQFVGITGLKVEDFNFLLPYFKAEWDEYNEFFTLKIGFISLYFIGLNGFRSETI